MISKRQRPKLEPIAGFIDDILETDRHAPRKQRHTAHRIWRRMREEKPEWPVGESTIRRYVRQRKGELSLVAHETCIPQSYAWGVEAQVDWYEAWAEMEGEREKVAIFCMRSMASGAAFHRAYRHATQQAFLGAHEEAFAYFGGVFRRLRYDYVPGHIIVATELKETSEISERDLVRFQEGLLGGSGIGPMEGSRTCHTPHAEDLGLALATELSLSLVPVDLSLLPPCVGLGDEGLLSQQSELCLPDTDIHSYRRLGNRVRGMRSPDPLVDPMGGMALLAACLPISLQDVIDEGRDRSEDGSRT